MKKALIIVLMIAMLLGVSGQVMAADWVNPDHKDRVIDLTDKIIDLGDSQTKGATTDINDNSDANRVLVYVNQHKVLFPDAQPFINKDNRTLIPVRAVVEDMGCEVDWNGNSQLVTITKGDTSIQLKIGEKKANVNGNVITFDTSAEIVESRTFVPLRFVSESLGAQVAWVAAQKTVLILTSN